MSDYSICLINDSFPPVIDGVANAVENYARIISRGLGSVAVVTPHYPNADDSRCGFPVIRYPSLDTTAVIGYRAGIPLSPKVLDRLENSGFDLIHSHCPVTSTVLGRMLRDRIDKPLVLTYHTKFDIDIANAIHGRLLQKEAILLLAENCSACDEVWTVSRGAGENLRKIGYQGDYIVMPNGVDLPKGRAAERLIWDATSPYDLPEGVPVFLFVGRMMWYKGLRLLLDALKRVSNAGQDYRMVFIGGGGDSSEIEVLARDLGLSDKVHFLAPIHDREILRAWYSRADVFLFPSTFDTNGLVVREAAACALPSVLIRGSCAAEGVTDGVNGFLTEEDPISMAELLLKLCRAPETVCRVGENAQGTLYLSWGDAVKMAYERYGVIVDNYARGTYAEHRRFRDELFHTAARAMDDLNRVHAHAEEVREEIKRYMQ